MASPDNVAVCCSTANQIFTLHPNLFGPPYVLTLICPDIDEEDVRAHIHERLGYAPSRESVRIWSESGTTGLSGMETPQHQIYLLDLHTYPYHVGHTLFRNAARLLEPDGNLFILALHTPEKDASFDHMDTGWRSPSDPRPRWMYHSMTLTQWATEYKLDTVSCTSVDKFWDARFQKPERSAPPPGK